MRDPLSRLGLTRVTLINSARTATAALISVFLARLLKMPEFYWAPISAIVILLFSTINPMTLAWQRFAGTALGATLGALIATFFPPHEDFYSWLIYGAGVFVCGLLASIFRLATAYRFAAIALSIVFLIAHTRSPWIVALHRFIEVSVGIAVALAVALLWPPPAEPSGG